MKFTETRLPGVFLVEPERHADERGYFARTFCKKELTAHGLQTRVAQCSLSFNPRRGTLRGMHFQTEPHAEVKMVRCSRGAIYDVVVDLRPQSSLRGQWFAAELTAANGRMLYIPAGFAHGFLTLTDDTEVCYQMSESYAPECARGIRWDDPAICIDWPFSPAVISSRDAGYPLLLPGGRFPGPVERQ